MAHASFILICYGFNLHPGASCQRSCRHTGSGGLMGGEILEINNGLEGIESAAAYFLLIFTPPSRIIFFTVFCFNYFKPYASLSDSIL
ncbi:hypothetical protein SDC9_153325 [bioreactor metagenome]|uniref:Uncharacterized protein n=1 Tax=bioreactor metagenome TaxID=1076179 RepID=A0A645EX85_9ZZZZ